MTGEILFADMGEIDESFLIEAEQYRRGRQWEKCRKQLVPAAASVCLTVILTALECIL